MLSTRTEKWGGVSTVEKPAVDEIIAKFQWKSLNEAVAKKIGTELGADFIVAGSLTKIGKLLSLDIALLDVSEKKPVQRIYLSAENVAALPLKIREIARRLNFSITGKKFVSSVFVTGNKLIEKDAVVRDVFFIICPIVLGFIYG